MIFAIKLSEILEKKNKMMFMNVEKVNNCIHIQNEVSRFLFDNFLFDSTLVLCVI